MKRRDALLEALYAELPKIECKGLCSNSCAYIGMTKAERDRIARDGKPVPGFLDDPCKALVMARCTIYEHRPLICRMFGVAIGMECSHGCVPERLLTREEGREFLRRAEEISRGT